VPDLIPENESMLPQAYQPSVLMGTVPFVTICGPRCLDVPGKLGDRILAFIRSNTIWETKTHLISGIFEGNK
jgi:hypothetical protein